MSTDEAGQSVLTAVAPSTDTRVFLHVTFTQALATQRTLRVEWIEPAGTTAFVGDHVLPAGWTGFWNSIVLPVSARPGLWRVRYAIDGAFAGESSFTVLAALTITRSWMSYDEAGSSTFTVVSGTAVRRVYAHLQFSQSARAGTHNLYFRWVDPVGTVVHTSNQSFIVPGNWTGAWYYLESTGPLRAGAWRVEVVVNGVVATEIRFTVM